MNTQFKFQNDYNAEYWAHAAFGLSSMNYGFVDGHVSFLESDYTRQDRSGAVQFANTTETLWDCYKK